MKNIHVLPTDKPSRLFKFANQLHLDTIPKDYYKKYNIYITNSEEIKDGEYGICLNLVREGFKSHQSVFKMDSEQRESMEFLGGQKKAEVLKVILTSEPRLIQNGVQAITDEFLEWFVKNPSCEEVEVDKGYRGVNLFNYKIIIPKEELHSMDDEVECNMCGGYMYLLPDNSMYVCTNSECTRCYEEEDEEPEQETLEEAKQEQKQHLIDLMRLDEQETLEEVAVNCWAEGAWDNRDDFTDGFIEGAKWQQEQDKNKYSEEEVSNIVEQTIEKFYKHIYVETKSEMKELWFEQFKKK